MSARNKPAAKKQRRAEREAKKEQWTRVRLAQQAAEVVIPLRRMWGHYL